MTTFTAEGITFVRGLTVKPFSGKDYHRNAARCHESETPCVVCGKPVHDEPNKVMALVIDGGGAWGDPDSYDANDGGFMGFYPVGSGCAKRFRLKA